MQDTLGSILNIEKKKIPVVGLDKNVEKQKKKQKQKTQNGIKRC